MPLTIKPSDTPKERRDFVKKHAKNKKVALEILKAKK